ncbi:ArsR family transcriptional regulator [Bacillus sp. 31A1R]|uniref:ArsR family transcriptional regulator n=1 Tax=Robertmurraya mangrovi TaxID=3098077 RepID=A0ABU5J0S1_9BACI|nr:ArsR family transcriptional regulator [Bacillus sp. 31A1R]MDZ5473003.1 ArsR family transcriptional regulator [Bacillus sp. 31A1R]
MSYRLVLDSTPLYDFCLSFGMFKKPLGLKFLKILDIGADWKKNVTELVGESFFEKLTTGGELHFLDVIELLIDESPEKGSVRGFLKWLEGLGAGELYELLAPHMTQTSLSFNLDVERNRCVELMYEWEEKYFSTLKKIDSFKQDINEKEKLIKELSSDEFILKITGGLVIEPYETLEKVIVTPTLHHSPLFTTCTYEKVVIVRYPFFEGDPTELERNKIINVGRALSDVNRLEMLKLLSTGKYNMTEIAKAINTTKANAHHHLLILRTAGLVKSHETGDKYFLDYSLNQDFPSLLKDELNQFFNI